MLRDKGEINYNDIEIRVVYFQIIRKKGFVNSYLEIKEGSHLGY